jgi:hypothetical protein
MDHPAGLGFVPGRDPGIPDDLVAGDREEVDRAIDIVRFVEFDLQVESLGRLAGEAQAIHVRSIRPAEVRPADNLPLSHGTTA